MAEEKKEELSIEESFAALDEMVRQMESDEVSLEGSFCLYEKGMKMLKDINDRIDKVEKQIQVLDGAETGEDAGSAESSGDEA